MKTRGRARSVHSVAAAERELRELGDLLVSGARVLLDISRRIKRGRRPRRLLQERERYRQLVDRLVSAYHSALDRYLLAISDALSADIAADSPQTSIPAPDAPDADRALAGLAAELQQTREGWLAAVMRLRNEVINETPTTIPLPDGTISIQKAGRERALAFEKYQQALARFKSAASSISGKPWPSA
jgi:hypothetical protein